MSFKLKLPMHGRSHRGRGSDPTWPGRGDPLFFDWDNQGGYVYVQTNDCVDLDTLPDPLAVGGTIGLALEDDSGCGALFGSTGPVIIKSQAGQVSIQAAVSPLTLIVNGNTFEFRDDGTIHGPTGGSLVFDL